MKVLIACEFTGIVRDAFARHGHDAWSCDLLPTESPGNHIQDDVLRHLNKGWDLMIAHPPCTYLSVSGAAWFDSPLYPNRRFDQLKAMDFFFRFAKADIEKICIENPVGVMNTFWRPPDQIIHPYHFGDPFSKATCLWLKNLERLTCNFIDAPMFGEHMDKGEFIRFDSGKTMPKWYAQLRGDGHSRSMTFPGIAEAMAAQWGKE